MPKVDAEGWAMYRKGTQIWRMKVEQGDGLLRFYRQREVRVGLIGGRWQKEKTTIIHEAEFALMRELA